MSTRKRWHTPSAKPGELKMAYGQEYGNRDLYYCYGGAGACKADMRLLMAAFEGVKLLDGKTLREELEARGYDITTLKFSIQQKTAGTGR